MAYQNFFATKLYTDIGAGDTTITLETPPTATSGRLALEARNATQRELIAYTGVSGNQITGVTRGIGGTSAKSHIKNALVEMNMTAEDIADLYAAFASFSAVNTDWRTLVGVTSVVTQWGQRSADMQTAGDVTGIISKGMRLRLPRTGTAVQTQSTSLNGTTQYWNDTTVNGMTFTDDYSLGAWVKLTAYGTGSIIGRRPAGVASGFNLETTSDGRFQITGLNGANYKLASSYQSLPLNKWVHVAGTADLSGNNFALYLDGVPIPFSIATSGSPGAIVQAGNVEVGSRSGADYFNGKIAQAFISAKILSPADIRSLMNAPLTNALCVTHNIVSAYAFDGNGNDINTTNANNLAAVNAAGFTTDSPFNANAFAIVMTDPVFGGVNTTYNVQYPEGYPVPSQTLGTVSYSGVSVPYGFPKEKQRWNIESLYRSGLFQNQGANSTWYQLVGAALTIPTGSWADYGMEGNFYQGSSAAANQSGWIVMANATPVNGNVIDGGNNYPIVRLLALGGITAASTYTASRRQISLSAASTYNTYTSTDAGATGSSGGFQGVQGQVRMFAENSLL